MKVLRLPHFYTIFTLLFSLFIAFIYLSPFISEPILSGEEDFLYMAKILASKDIYEGTFAWDIANYFKNKTLAITLISYITENNYEKLANYSYFALNLLKVLSLCTFVFYLFKEFSISLFVILLTLIHSDNNFVYLKPLILTQAKLITSSFMFPLMVIAITFFIKRKIFYASTILLFTTLLHPIYGILLLFSFFLHKSIFQICVKKSHVTKIDKLLFITALLAIGFSIIYFMSKNFDSSQNNFLYVFLSNRTDTIFPFRMGWLLLANRYAPILFSIYIFFKHWKITGLELFFYFFIVSLLSIILLLIQILISEFSTNISLISLGFNHRIDWSFAPLIYLLLTMIPFFNFYFSKGKKKYWLIPLFLVFITQSILVISFFIFLVTLFEKNILTRNKIEKR